MSTVAERQRISFVFESEAEASGHFTLRAGTGQTTAPIPYDAVRHPSVELGIGSRWQPSNKQMLPLPWGPTSFAMAAASFACVRRSTYNQFMLAQTDIPILSEQHTHLRICPPRTFVFSFQTANMVASALSTLDEVGNVDVYERVTSITAGTASWSYTITFKSIVGDVDPLVVGAGKKVVGASSSEPSL